jgi:hypothetical protein
LRVILFQTISICIASRLEVGPWSKILPGVVGSYLALGRVLR